MCIYIYVCICMYVCMYTCLLRIHRSWNMSVDTIAISSIIRYSSCIYKYVYIICIHRCVCVCIYMYIYVYTYAYMNICIIRVYRSWKSWCHGDFVDDQTPCLYIYVCISYTCVCVRVFVYTYMYIYLFIWMRLFVWYICIEVETCQPILFRFREISDTLPVYICMHIIYMRAWVRVCVYIYIYEHVYLYMCTHVYV